MKVNNSFIKTIQHYQEALACMEVASSYLRNSELQSSFKQRTAFEHRNNLLNNASQLYKPPSPITNCLHEGSIDGNDSGYTDLSNSTSSGVDPGSDLHVSSSDSGRHLGAYRPNAREPLRSYLSRDQASSTVDFSIIKGLVDRCSAAIGAIQEQTVTENVIVKDSLQSLVESLKFQKRLLEKRKRKVQRNVENRQTEQDATHPIHNNVNGVMDHVSSAVMAMRLNSNGGGYSPSEGLSNVIGLQNVKDVLTEAFILPSQFPHLFEGGALLSWSRLLLYGPPGTGKTKLARALASDLKCPLYMVSPSLLLSSWLGDTEKIIRELFARARSEPGPVIVFLDEVDALCRVRSQSEDDITRRIKTELLVHLESEGSYCRRDGGLMNDGEDVFSFSDGFEASSTPTLSNKLFVIAATNCPWDVDPAFMRRFEKRCYVELPHNLERISLLQSSLKGCSTSLSPSDWSTVGDATSGYSGADLNSIATSAAFKPIRELHSATFWRFTKDNKIMPCSNETLGAMQDTLDKLPPNRVTVRPVEVEDVLSSIKSTQKSVPQSLLQQYQEYQHN